MHVLYVDYIYTVAYIVIKHIYSPCRLDILLIRFSYLIGARMKNYFAL